MRFICLFIDVAGSQTKPNISNFEFVSPIFNRILPSFTWFYLNLPHFNNK